MPLDRSGHISGLETGSFSIEKAATQPHGRTLAGRPWPHAADFDRLSVLKSVTAGRKLSAIAKPRFALPAVGAVTAESL